MVIYRTTSPATVGAGPSLTGSGGPYDGVGPVAGRLAHDRSPVATRAGANRRAARSRIDPFLRPVGTPQRPGTRRGHRSALRTHDRPLPRGAPSSTVRRPGRPQRIVVRPRFHHLPSPPCAPSGAVVVGGTSLPNPVPASPDVDPGVAGDA